MFSTPAAALATVQLATIAAVSWIATLVAERGPIPSESGIWIGILICAVFATAFAFFIQTGAQRFIPPARTAVILVLEAPFAALFGYLMLDERTGARGMIGAALILAGVLTAELFAPAREQL